MTPDPLGPAIAEAFPDMQTVRFSSSGGKIGTEDRAFQATLGFVDPNFLDIFSFPVIHGDPAQALQDKYSVIITEKTAQKYFNNANPVGETASNSVLRERNSKLYHHGHCKKRAQKLYNSI